MAALEVSEMNKIVREVFGNPNKQNRSALSPDQIRRYVDDVIATLAGAPEKGLLLEFLLKLLVFDVDVQAQFIVNRGLLDQIEGLELATTEIEATRKKNLILYVVRKLLGKDVVQFGDDFIFELKKANQKLLALVIGPDELPASSAYLYHKYLASVLDVVEVKTNAVQVTLQEVLSTENTIKLSIEALKNDVAPLPEHIGAAQGKADAVEKKLVTLEGQVEAKLQDIRDGLTQVAVTVGQQVAQQMQVTQGLITQQGAELVQKINATDDRVTGVEDSLKKHKEETNAQFDQLNQKLDSVTQRLEELIAKSIADLEERLTRQINLVASDASEIKQGLETQQRQIADVTETAIPALQQKISVELGVKVQEISQSLETVREDLQGTKGVVLELARESLSAAEKEAEAAAAKRQAWEQTEYKLGGSRR